MDSPGSEQRPSDRAAELIERDGRQIAYYCVDESTECLSRRGWIGGDTLKTGDEIMTLNAVSGHLEWAPVDGIFRAPYDGPMVRITGRHLDALVTPNHRWLLSERKNAVGRWVETQALRHRHQLPLTGKQNTQPDSPISDDLLRLLGWFVTEGTVWIRPKNKTIFVRISQRADSPHCDAIRAALRGVGAKWSEWKSATDRPIRVFGLSGPIRHRLIELAPDRRLRWDIVTGLSGRQAIILRNAMLLGDGSQASRQRGDPWVFGQLLGPRLDIFQAIAAISGHASYLRERRLSGYGKRPVGAVTVKTTRRVTWVKQHVQTVPFVGMVWCPSTRNGTFLARRGGKTHVTGNSWKDTLRRAPGLPVDLLVELAKLTRDQVPVCGDPVAEMEWHIEHVLQLARRVVNEERRGRGLPPVVFFTATDTVATHLYQTAADGPLLGCETPLPGPHADAGAVTPVVCACRRYVLEQVRPHPLP